MRIIGQAYDVIGSGLLVHGAPVPCCTAKTSEMSPFKRAHIPQPSQEREVGPWSRALLEDNVVCCKCVLVDNQVCRRCDYKCHSHRCVPGPESNRLQFNRPPNLIHRPSMLGNRSRLIFLGIHHHCDMSSPSLSSVKNPTTPCYRRSHR